MRWFFRIYQFVTPLLLFPLTWYLWQEEYGQNLRFVLLAVMLPVISSYVVPGIGTNYLNLWEFNTRVRLGKFRPQHGFVFGTATALLVYLCLERSTGDVDVAAVLRAGLVVGSVIGFWAWFYDILAIEAGFITMYNRSWYLGEGPAEIATEYAPVYFGMVGCVYGMEVKVLERLLLQEQRWDLYGWLALGCTAFIILVPTASYMLFAKVRTGDWGLTSYRPPDEPTPD